MNVISAVNVRKVKYLERGVLTVRVVQQNIVAILESLSRSDLEDAKRKLQAITPEVRSDRERGGLLAASGIYASITKAKDGTMQSWDTARIERAARSITASQMADEFDIGYAEALMAYSRLIQNSQQSEA